MTRRITAILAAAAAALALAAPSWAGEVWRYSLTASGLGASAYWGYESRSGQDSVEVRGFEKATFNDSESNGPVPIDSQIVVSHYTRTGGWEAVCLLSDEFAQTKLESASLSVTGCRATVYEWTCNQQGCTDEPVSEALIDASVNWTGVGTAYRFKSAGKSSGDGYWDSFRSSGTQREAVLSGWVALDGVTYPYADADFGWGYLYDLREYFAVRTM